MLLFLQKLNYEILSTHNKFVHSQLLYDTTYQIMYFIMDYFPNTSLGIIKPTEYFAQFGSNDPIKEVAQCLEDLHATLDEPHTNLKPSNILITNEYHYLLSDYCLYSLDNPNCMRPIEDYEYYSPEVIKGCEYQKSSDIWSMGCIFYYLLTDKSPFYADNLFMLFNNIVNCRYSLNNIQDGKWKSLISKLLQFMPSSRLSINDVVNEIDNIINHPELASVNVVDTSVPFINEEEVVVSSHTSFIPSAPKVEESIPSYPKASPTIEEREVEDVHFPSKHNDISKSNSSDNDNDDKDDESKNNNDSNKKEEEEIYEEGELTLEEMIAKYSNPECVSSRSTDDTPTSPSAKKDMFSDIKKINLQELNKERANFIPKSQDKDSNSDNNNNTDEEAKPKDTPKKRGSGTKSSSTGVSNIRRARTSSLSSIQTNETSEAPTTRRRANSRITQSAKEIMDTPPPVPRKNNPAISALKKEGKKGKAQSMKLNSASIMAALQDPYARAARELGEENGGESEKPITSTGTPKHSSLPSLNPKSILF